ncbi:hypothetical protein ES702_00262 [subsurface metagenome]
MAKVAAVDCDEESNKPFCAQFGVQGFPTLKIVKPGKKAGRPIVEDYQGPREAKSIIEAVSDKITNHVKRLKADTLDAWVEGGSQAKAIVFSEKGTTAPLVKALAIDFLGSIEFAQVRSKETDAVNKYDVTQFPTIVLLSDKGEVLEKYNGEISKEALTKFLSQIAPPNPDPAPKKPKASATKKSKTPSASSASASSAFSKASEAQKSSDFEEYLEHASTVILDDNSPSDSPLPNVEPEQKPMAVPDVPAPLPTLGTADELRSACLQPSSHHCVLILLPRLDSAEAQFTGDAAEALSGFAAVEDKYSKRKANSFPAYAIPASNMDAAVVRQVLDLKSDTEVEVVVLNMKKGWAKKYSKSAFDVKSVEDFMEDIKFGEGKKQKISTDLFTQGGTPEEKTAQSVDVPEEPSPVPAAESSTDSASATPSTHDEL